MRKNPNIVRINPFKLLLKHIFYIILKEYKTYVIYSITIDNE